MKRPWWLGLSIAAVVCSVGLTTFSTLQAGAGARFGDCCVAVVDMEEIFREYLRQKDLTAELRETDAQIQAENERRRAKMDTLQHTLDAMSPTDPMYGPKTREMLTFQIDYKNWLDLIQADMAREVGLWTSRIYAEVQGVVQDIAGRQGVDIVLFKERPNIQGYDPDEVRQQIMMRKVVYASDSVNMTQAVLDKLNEDYRKLPRVKMLQVIPSMDANATP